MFSFWSNDDENSDHSDENDNERDENTKPERFLYVGNGKKSDCFRGESPNPLTGNDVFQSSRHTSVFNERKKKMDDMLNDVWSVRKDVRVNTNTIKATDVGTKSFYSRHAGVNSGVGGQTDFFSEKSTSTVTKTWSVPRSTYSYSDGSAINQYDILGDIDGPNVISNSILTDTSEDVNRRNIVNSIKRGMGTGPNREPSARTRRAQKFNNAYLRSTGLGKYTPGLAKLPQQHFNNSDKNDDR